MISEYKICTKCKLILPANKFAFRKDRNTLASACRLCRNMQKREYINSLSKTEKALLYRKEQLKKRYNISLEQFEQMLKKQHNKCAICKSNKVNCSIAKNMHVDHCHSTGKVRGLLCSTCNRGIGFLKDSPKLLKNAAKYLERHL